MRLVSFETGAPLAHSPARLGLVLPRGPRAGDVIDANRADPALPADALSFLREIDLLLPVARALLERVTAADDGPLQDSGILRSRDSIRLAAPVPRPGKIVGVARNYAAHAAERGQQELPPEPVLFIKASSAVIGPERAICLPRASSEVDYEGELAVVIGRPARDLRPAEALACVAGYCVANDVTARDFQNVRGQRFIGKSCDGFAPLGPELVTADEIADPQALRIRTFVSGELRQNATTAEMIFSVREIVAFVSRLMTLEPGDVLLTGTPSGVGAASQPPRWLRDGDRVEVEIEGLGRLRNPVRGGPAA